MANRKMKFAALACATLCLAGCKYEVKPANYDEAIVETNDTITNNFYGKVYEYLRDNGTLNSAAFDEVLTRITNSELKKLYEGDNAVFANEAEEKAEEDRLINEKLYEVISSESYQTDKHFDEEKLVISLKKQFYNIKKIGTNTFNKGTVVFTPETKESALKEGKLGGRDQYAADNILHYDYTEYIEENLRKEVRKDMLYAKFVQDEKYRIIGTSYARKVSIVAINPDGDDEYANDTINGYIKDFVVGGKEINFNDLAKLWKGVDFSNADHELDAELATTKTSYGLHTLAEKIDDEFGKFVDTYDVNAGTYALKNRDVRDDSLYSTYTASHTQSPLVGLQDKQIELGQKSLVTEGWFIKSDSISDVPSEITDRLFDIKTAQDFQALSNSTDATGYSDYRFVRKVTNAGKAYYFLTKSLTENTESFNDIVFNVAGTYYMVMIEDAMNSTSLNVTGKTGDVKRAVLNKAFQIAEMLGKKDANKTEAIIHYLENANLMFHDQAIYDYFYENYKDAFEND